MNLIWQDALEEFLHDVARVVVVWGWLLLITMLADLLILSVR